MFFPECLANEHNCDMTLFNYDNLDVMCKRAIDLSKALI